jgi:hypothetical protein
MIPLPKSYYELMGKVPPKRGKNRFPKENYRVGSAQAFDGTVMPGGWTKEILKAGFAIIHNKIMAIDPFSKTAK